MGPPCRSWKPTATSYCLIAAHRSTGHCSAISSTTSLVWLWWHPKTCAVSRSVGHSGLAGGAWLWPVASAHCGCSQRNPENPVTCGLRGRRKPVQEARSGFLSDSLRPASGHGFGGRFQLSQAKDTQRRAGFGRRPGTALSGYPSTAPWRGQLENLDRNDASGRMTVWSRPSWRPFPRLRTERAVTPVSRLSGCEG